MRDPAPPDLEEAPPVFSVWTKQRTRWLKGWLQTVLVHTREPLAIFRQLGFWPTMFFHLMITSVVISMLIHPVFLVHTGWEIAMAASGGHSITHPLLFGLSTFNLAGGYTTYAFLALGVMRMTGAPVSARWLFTLPAYWLIISVAGWRALWQFAVAPSSGKRRRTGWQIPTKLPISRKRELMPG